MKKQAIKVIIPQELTFSQNVRLNLRRYSDCCSKDSWIVSFSCRTDNLVIRFSFQDF